MSRAKDDLVLIQPLRFLVRGQSVGGNRHVYAPTTPRMQAQRSAVRHLLSTFFNGSRAAAVSALLDEAEQPLTPSERAEFSAVVKRLRAEGR